MAIDEKDVRKIAGLARMELSEEEIKLYQGQLVNILSAIDELEKLDTVSVEPTTAVLGLSNVMREDLPSPFADVDKILANAPEREGRYFKVRKVME